MRWVSYFVMINWNLKEQGYNLMKDCMYYIFKKGSAYRCHNEPLINGLGLG